MTCPSPSRHTLQSCTDGPVFAEIRALIKCLSSLPHIGIAVLDSHFRYLSLNQALAAMNGVPVHFHSGKTVRQVLGPTGLELEPRLEHVFTTGESTGFEFSAQLPNRHEMHHWKVMCLPIRNLLGRVEQICAVVTELSEDNTLKLSLFGLSRKLLTLQAMVNRNTTRLSGGGSNGRDGDFGEVVVHLLNACVSELVALSKMPSFPLQELTEEILNEYQTFYCDQSKLPSSACASPADCLTPREREVVRYLAEGKCNKEIAAALHLSVKTVETYRTRIMPKLGAHSLSDVTRFAVCHRIITISLDQPS